MLSNQFCVDQAIFTAIMDGAVLCNYGTLSGHVLVFWMSMFDCGHFMILFASSVTS